MCAFRSKALGGPWSYAGNDLPADFARIPGNSQKAHVLASLRKVPGNAPTMCPKRYIPYIRARRYTMSPMLSRRMRFTMGNLGGESWKSMGADEACHDRRGIGGGVPDIRRSGRGYHERAQWDAFPYD
jgi:hypothetical protein